MGNNLNFKKTKMKGNKIILGTAQFGNNYGIANDNKCSERTSVNIIKFAEKNKIKEIDLATLYNNLDIISKANLKKFKIILKINIKNSDYNNFNNKIVKEIKNTELKIKKKINTILIHNQNFFKFKNSKLIFKKLLILKKKKIINKIGISIYDIKLIPYIIKKFKIDIIQLPFNIIDQRLDNQYYLKILKKKKIKIHVRSIFLQGLLLQKKIPDELKNFNSIFEEYKNFCKSLKKKQLEICLNFISSFKFVDKIVIGVNSKKELIEILRNKEQTIKIAKLSKRQKISQLIDPRKW